MNKIVKDAMVLTAITLIAGFLLGLVHDITLDPIAQAEYEKTQNAYKEVFADADSFKEYEDFDADAATKTAGEAGYENDIIEGAQVALDASGNPLGYVITITSTEGSQANITLSIGNRDQRDAGPRHEGDGERIQRSVCGQDKRILYGDKDRRNSGK